MLNQRLKRLPNSKLIMIAAFILLATLVLSACGSGNTKEGASNNGQANQGQNKNQNEPQKAVAEIGKRNTDPAVITFYNASNSNATQEAFLESPIGAAAQKKFPHVEIRHIATGKGTQPAEILMVEPNIDIVINSIYSYAELQQTEILYDINELIKKYNVDLTRFDPTTIEFQQKMGNGAVYGLPIATTTAVLFYNRDLFERFAEEYPRDGMTWDEVYEKAKRMTRVENGEQYYGFATRYPFMYSTNQLSLSYYNPEKDELTVNSEGFRKFIDNFARFYQIEGNQGATHTAFWEKENVAMIAWQIGNWDHVNWDAVSLPYFTELPGIGPQSYSTFWNIAGTSKNKDLAFEILEFVTSDEYQVVAAKSGSGPGVISPEVVRAFGTEADGSGNTRNLQDKNLQAFFPQHRANSSYITTYDNAIAKHMNKAFDQVAQGQKDMITALREAEEAAQQEINAMKK